MEGRPPNFLGLALSARKNLCIHPEVSQEEEGKGVDSKCHKLTASFVREKHAHDPSIAVCPFYEVNYHSLWYGVFSCTAFTTRSLNIWERKNFLPFHQASMTWWVWYLFVLMCNELSFQDDLKTFGRSKEWCPYYLARYAVRFIVKKCGGLYQWQTY